jgi:hypothetical protein
MITLYSYPPLFGVADNRVLLQSLLLGEPRNEQSPPNQGTRRSPSGSIVDFAAGPHETMLQVGIAHRLVAVLPDPVRP